MVRTRLTPYILRLKNKKTDKFEGLNDICSSGLVFSKILENIFNKHNHDNKNSKPFCDDSLQRLICFQGKIKKKSIGETFFIHSKINYGEYGLDRPVINKNQNFFNKFFSKFINKEESPLKCLSFTYFESKSMPTQAFVLVHSHSLDCYKTILDKLIQKELNSISSINVNLEFHPVFNNILAEKLEKGGKIIEMQFISNDVPKDVADHDFSKNFDKIMIEHSQKFTLSFKSKNGENLISLNKERIKNFATKIKEKILNPKATLFYEGIDVPLEQIKVLVNLNKKNYSIVFDKEGEYFRESLYLDEREIQSEGKILHDRIYPIAESYAKQILGNLERLK
jgi:hypothetical protein